VGAGKPSGLSVIGMLAILAGVALVFKHGPVAKG
jgi:hypothetical protein